MADTTIASSCADRTGRVPSDLRVTVKLLVVLLVLAAMLKVAGFRRSHALLGRISSRSLRRRRRWPTLQHSPRVIAARVVRVNRHVLPFQSRCLLESMALWYLLRRSGHPAELLLGARTLTGPFQAHAWVESAGEVLNDSEHVREIYTPFELPATEASTSLR